MNNLVFISYRRDGGEFTGKILYDALKERGFEVFFDVESMNAGRFDQQIFETIDKCDSIVLILSKGALDRCSNEQDWVRKELEYAMSKNKNIVPVMLRGFTWPEDLPDSLSDLHYYEGVKASTDYWEATVDRICGYLNANKKDEPVKASGTKAEGGKSKGPLIAGLIISCITFIIGIALCYIGLTGAV